MAQRYDECDDGGGHGPWGPLPPKLRALIDDVLVPGIPRIAESITAEVHRHSALLGDDPEAWSETRASAEANLRLALPMWRDGQDPRDAGPPHAAIAYARVYAHEGRSFFELLRAYRIAEEHLLRILRHELGAHLPSSMVINAVDAAARFIFWRTDAVLEHLEGVYRLERDAWQRSSVAARRQLLAAILAGEPVDVDDASARLSYDLRRHHLGVILWSDATPEDAGAGELERGARALAGALGTETPLIDALGGLAIAAWFGCWEPVRADAIDAAGGLLGRGLRCGVGTCRPGLDGFRATHSEALHARKAATILRVPGAAVHYPAVSLAALLAENPEHARTFVVDELGALFEGDRPEPLARLRETVETYLELASVAETARRLGVHENTVQNRLQRAAELRGRSLREGTLELHVALHLARLLPAL
jgi:hypothetical protein